MPKKTAPAHAEIRLADYAPPDFLVDRVTLDIDIQPGHAHVASRLEIRRNPKSKNRKAPLVLQGEAQKLLSVKLHDSLSPHRGERGWGEGGDHVHESHVPPHPLPPLARGFAPSPPYGGRGVKYRLTEKELIISNMPDRAVLEIVSTHDPYKNTALSGLYQSGPMLSTQCEAEGFRRITYYPDRPDVMAKFRVTIHADREKYPVLLANGNLVASGKEGKSRHWATWEDPHPKPCYLFAMVAGKLDKVTDHFRTKSGRKVLIEIYVEPGKTKETGFAIAALKKAMKWDEDTYGLEYDLDRFMMVATPFFNMGAMENKGLNIFNDACVLGRPETATDATISFIERVVGHEYFHNWTGNRITCRDWFQLSLKEGLTVFREQEFCGDMNSVAAERLGNVRSLRRSQFAEDSGAMAHPVRPDRYQAIDNFYTATVYSKGAEVCRMIQTLVGRKGFRKGMDLYVKRHDGQAVTCDDFIKAMADANRSDLKQFMLWYSQAGTPVVKVVSRYDAKAKILRLSAQQSCPPTPGQKNKRPMHIPLAVGLLDGKGRDLIGTHVVSIKKPREEFVFKNIKAKPVLSLLRDFSAPVRLIHPQTDDELLFLLAHDSDPFNRWEAGYKLLTQYILTLTRLAPLARGTLSRNAGEGGALRSGEGEGIINALDRILRDPKLDAAFKTMVLALPSEGELGLAQRAEGKLIDVDALYAARKKAVLKISSALRGDFQKIHARLRKLDPRAADGVSMGRRGLKNLSLAYLAAGEDEPVLQLVFKQAVTAKNMTDQIAALGILSDTVSPLRDKAFAAFEKRWRHAPTIMDKWLAVQAGAKRQDVLKQVQKLLRHPAFDLKNPNRISALIGAFAANGLGFHDKTGAGYRFIGDMIVKIDPINPHSAAALARSFARWRDYDLKRQALMKQELRRLAADKKLSANTMEVVKKSLF